MIAAILRLTLVCAVALAAAAMARADDAPNIGPTPIPFYTGNLSVFPFMSYWGTYKGPAGDWASPEHLALLKRIGCFADCDYQAWALAEPEPGKWDFGMYLRNADALRAAGFEYIPFAWVHFPPKWFQQRPEFVPYECVEHGEKLMQLSPWAPNALDLYRQYYGAQRKAMGERIGWIRVGTPSDYGEIGYPAAMTSWLVPQKHAHAGYWCGDRYARADFRDQVRKRFGSLAALNARWGTRFATWRAVDYPDVAEDRAAAQARKTGKATDRRRWLDFVEWYYGVWLRFVPQLVSVIRHEYPGHRLIASVGYASERTCFGNDYSAIPKMARGIGIALQTPGNVSYYGVKRVSTACHFYGCPFYTEPPGDVPLNAEIARVFCDVSNGVQVYFEYPQNLDRARAQLREYKAHMTGKAPVVDVAIWHPSVAHRLNAGTDNWPMDAFLLGEQGRDRFDFDVVDEALMRDGALPRYRLLVHAGSAVTEEAALRKVAAWVRAGGVLLTCGSGAVETVEGDRSLWRSLVPARVPGREAVCPGGKWDWQAVSRGCVRRVGRGLVVRLPVAPDERPLLIDAVTHLAYDLAGFAPGFRNAPRVDGEADGVQATLLPDRILYFNPTDQPIAKRVTFRPEDWARRARKPERMEETLELRPHSIAAVMLR